MLIGCGLRRGELLALRVDAIELREEHSVIADLMGKAGHMRTVPIPAWVKAAIDEWKQAWHHGRGHLSINQQEGPGLGQWDDGEGAVTGRSRHRQPFRLSLGQVTPQ
jgi:integrase